LGKCQHASGGIGINSATHEVSGQPGLYAIGPLTQGVLLYVSAMEQLALHADRIANHLLSSLAPVKPVAPFNAAESLRG
jgi:uncharacterized NAD(P)/FAD-binding protein YdhS